MQVAHRVKWPSEMLAISPDSDCNADTSHWQSSLQHLDCGTLIALCDIDFDQLLHRGSLVDSRERHAGYWLVQKLAFCTISKYLVAKTSDIGAKDSQSGSQPSLNFHSNNFSLGVTLLIISLCLR